MDEVQPPVVVMGMHRSGTSLVVELLTSLGVFTGRRRDVHGEAHLFLGLNRWLLSQAGGRWDHPGPVRHLLADGELRRLSMARLRRALEGLEARSFVGWWGRLRGGIRTLDRPWGWKDPRNTFTLPLWLDLFPEARVVHVRRHGVDVAASLRRRTNRSLRERREIFDRRGVARIHRHDGFADSPRTRSLEGGFSLWEEYLAEASRHRARLGGRILELEFGDLVGDPRAARDALARFLGLPASAAESARIPDVRGERALAFRNEPELCAFADRVSDRLRSRGYEP